MKTCSKCHKDKELECFTRHKALRDGHLNWCKSCKAAYEKERRAKRPDESRGSKLLHRYGITIDQYDDLIKFQDGRCALCPATIYSPNKPVRLAVDHDNLTGAIRGLLCNKCNRGIGLLDHDIARLELAINYLKKGM